MIGRIAIKKAPRGFSGLFMSGGTERFKVTWLENKIYVVSNSSNLVHVYSDQEPFDELKDDRIELKKMRTLGDIAASGVSRSIFISEGNGYIFKIQMPSKEISQWKIKGRPWGLSINSSDELIVVVVRRVGFLLLMIVSI